MLKSATAAKSFTRGLAVANAMNATMGASICAMAARLALTCRAVSRRIAWCRTNVIASTPMASQPGLASTYMCSGITAYSAL
jgi:hypothetical protein